MYVTVGDVEKEPTSVGKTGSMSNSCLTRDSKNSRDNNRDILSCSNANDGRDVEAANFTESGDEGKSLGDLSKTDMYHDRDSYNSRGNVNPEQQRSGLQDRPQTLHGKQARTFEQIRQLMDSKSRLVSQREWIGSHFSGSNSEQRCTVSQPASEALTTSGSETLPEPGQGRARALSEPRGRTRGSIALVQSELFAFLRGLGFSSLAVMLKVWPWP